MKTYIKITFSVFTLSLIVLGANFALAMPVELSLTPSKYELTIEPGQSKEVSIKVINNSDQKVTASVSVENFLPSENEDEIIKFSNANSSYSGKELLYLPQKSIELNPQQEVNLPVVVSIPTSLPHGGRFAVVFVTFAGDSNLENSGTNVQSRLGSLFFIRVGKNYSEAGELTRFGVINNQKILFGGPMSFYVTYKNDGDVHLNPYGGVHLDNILGGNKLVEIEPWFVLPGATRTKVIEAGLVGWKIGKIKANLELNRGYKDMVDEAQVSFWVVSWKSLALLGGLVAGALVTYGIKKNRA